MQRNFLYLLLLCLLFSCRKKDTPTPVPAPVENNKLDAYGKALVKVEAAINEQQCPQSAYYNLSIQDLGLLSVDVPETKPLLLKWGCYGATHYLPVAGVTTNKTPQGKFSYTNYGNGQCNSFPISEY